MWESAWRFLDRAVAFAPLAEGMVKDLTELPFLAFVGPRCPGVANDIVAAAR